MGIEEAIQAYDFPADRYRRIIVFRDEEVFRETMAANPNMTAIMGVDGLTRKTFPGIFVAGITGEASSQTG